MPKVSCGGSNIQSIPKVDLAEIRVSPKGTLAFPHLAEPKQYEMGKPKFELVLLFGLDDPGVKELKSLVDRVALQEFSGSNFDSPIKRGGRGDTDLFVGKFYVRFSSRTRPQIVDAEINDIDPLEISNDADVNVGFSIKPYDIKGKLGIRFELTHVRVESKRASAREVFANI